MREKNTIKIFQILIIITLLLSLFAAGISVVAADEREAFNTNYLEKMTALYKMWAAANKGAIFDNWANLEAFVLESLDRTNLDYIEIYNTIDGIETTFNDTGEIVLTPDICKVCNVIWNMWNTNYKNHTYQLRVVQTNLTQLDYYTSKTVVQLPRYYDNKTLSFTKFDDGYIRINETAGFYKTHESDSFTSGTEFPEYDSFTVSSGNGVPVQIFYGRTSDYENFSLYTAGEGTASTKLYLYNLDNAENYTADIEAFTEGTIINNDNSLHENTIVNLNNYDSVNYYIVTQDKYFILIQSTNVIKVKTEDAVITKPGSSTRRLNFFYNWTGTQNVCSAPNTCSNQTLQNETNLPVRIYDMTSRDIYFNNVKIGESWLTLTTGSTFKPLMTANSNYYQIMQGVWPEDWTFDDVVISNKTYMNQNWTSKVYDLYTDYEYGTNDQIVLDNAIYNLLHDQEIDPDYNPETDETTEQSNEIFNTVGNYFNSLQGFENTLDTSITDQNLLGAFQLIGEEFSYYLTNFPILNLGLVFMLIFAVIAIILR